MDLETILRQIPWEKKKKKRALNYVWRFPLSTSRQDFWPYLIDTSALNQRMKLPPFTYEEVDGLLHGRTKQGGIELEWVESPWEWIYLQEMSNARTYSKGFAEFIRTRFFLEETSSNTCLLTIYVGLIPKNNFFRVFLKVALPKLEKSFRDAFESIQSEIQQKSQGLELPPNLSKTFEPEPELLHAESVPSLLSKLQEKGVSNGLIQNLEQLILTWSDSKVDRIRLKDLQILWQVELDELLFAFLWGCRIGIFTLSWDTICPHCRGVRSKIQKLGDLPETDDCEVCEIQFDTTKPNAIEVTFHIHPSIRKVEKQIFCAAEPAKKNHILLNKFVLPSKGFSLQLNVGSGTFRIREKGEQNFHVMVVDETNDSSHFEWGQKFGEKKVSPNPEIHYVNTSPKPTTLVIEERKEDKQALRPYELFSYSEFRDIFSEEALSTNLQLDIGLQTILFTDIVGSTSFYKQVGDHGAFKEVNRHFALTYKTIKEFKGVVVKTIGDSVMAGFPSPLLAVQASKRLQGLFQTDSDSLVKIRITIHQGNCLAVNLNSHIDYFGSTVNYAAKMQSRAHAGEIVFSEKIFRDPGLRDYLKLEGIKLKKSEFTLLPDEKPLPIYTWKPEFN